MVFGSLPAVGAGGHVGGLSPLWCVFLGKRRNGKQGFEQITRAPVFAAALFKQPEVATTQLFTDG